MSSNPLPPIRGKTKIIALFFTLSFASPALAQERESIPGISSESSAPQDGTIDLLLSAPEGELDARRIEECERETDAAQISGEILVCRDIVEDNSHYYSGDRDSARQRYAEETQYADALQTPSVDGEGITGRLPFGVGATMKGCFFPPCPPPPALIVDVTALPEAPPGSDADRIARGLPPIGDDVGNASSQSDLLGLPAADEAEEDPSVIRAESAAPADPQ